MEGENVKNNKAKDKAKNKIVIFMLQILGFVILLGAVFFGTYYLFIGDSMNSYEKNVKEIISKINDVNSSTASYSKGQAIDSEKLTAIRKEIPEKIQNLTVLKDKLQTITASDKYKADHENLTNGLEKNITIYRQIDAIYRDPEGKDIDKAADNLKTYMESCINYYSKIINKNLIITLPEGCVTFIENTLNYAYELGRIQRDKEITQNQNAEFIESLDNIASKFSPLKIDFSIQLSKTRNEGGNLDNIIALANKNDDELNYIRQEFSNLAVPAKAVNCYKLFNTAMDSYESYLQSFIYAVKNEKLAGSNLTSEKLAEIYSDSTSKYNAAEKNYNSFLKTFTEFKNAN
ncbi:hypothetical protein M2651_06760 [Clostridium sp. SYSU_GA19001]|uniref:hypothetical protein n=1 Tax=Clostridium caldaquaticum TaxID=2940653 RepID=UPI002076F029|nr:hypothetical protein [Clostridium caldaquaticum]MCM8710728.1 hypothetical protein [Clostridium caldaquaticum]